MQTGILYLFTRTPLHVGAGSSVGAIDQPIIRERHTGFPVIPASSLKGTFADSWNDTLQIDGAGDSAKLKRVKDDGTAGEAAWLFGSDNDKHAASGSLLFSEARVLAFPIRSARGSYAWITCPLMLQRAARDGVFATTCGAAITQQRLHGLRFSARGHRRAAGRHGPRHRDRHPAPPSRRTRRREPRPSPPAGKAR
jgi:CRISPR type III-B/RAMP module RAMP protein Cmr4